MKSEALAEKEEEINTLLSDLQELVNIKQQHQELSSLNDSLNKEISSRDKQLTQNEEQQKSHLEQIAVLKKQLNEQEQDTADILHAKLEKISELEDENEQLRDSLLLSQNNQQNLQVQVASEQKMNKSLNHSKIQIEQKYELDLQIQQISELRIHRRVQIEERIWFLIQKANNFYWIEEALIPQKKLPLLLQKLPVNVELSESCVLEKSFGDEAYMEEVDRIVKEKEMLLDQVREKRSEKRYSELAGVIEPDERNKILESKLRGLESEIDNLNEENKNLDILNKDYKVMNVKMKKKLMLIREKQKKVKEKESSKNKEEEKKVILDSPTKELTRKVDNLTKEKAEIEGEMKRKNNEIVSLREAIGVSLL